MILPNAVHDQLRQHGEIAYPHECCGILLGTVDRIVTEAIRTRNTSDHPWNHYEIAPLDLIRAERKAREAGLQIVGFYHSHPNHPAHWSTTDLAEAHWIGCSYVITSIEKGAAIATRSFLLDGTTEDDKRFEAEELRVESGKPPENAAALF